MRAARPDDHRLLSSVSLIDEYHGRAVRMGNLAFIGSHGVNGVSALHTGLMRETVFSDLHALFPDRIVNKTNGITFRRWLHQANVGLTGLLVEAVGPRVLDDETALEALRPLAGDAAFQQRFAKMRHANKLVLAALIREQLDIVVDPAALFDVQIKRIHEYKRQLLNILETIALYDAIRADPMQDWTPRVKIFAGKAAAGYHQAKLIIKLAHDVARVDQRRPGRRRSAEGRVPAQLLRQPGRDDHSGGRPLRADLDRRDGSVRHRQHEARAERRAHHRHAGRRQYRDPRACRRREHVHLRPAGRRGRGNGAPSGVDATEAIAGSGALSGALAAIEAGVFSPDERDRYHGLVNALRHHDHFLVCADFDAYFATQRKADALWRDPPAWWKASILNTAGVAWFSSDRCIRDYARELWNVPAWPEA